MLQATAEEAETAGDGEGRSGVGDGALAGCRLAKENKEEEKLSHSIGRWSQLGEGLVGFGLAMEKMQIAEEERRGIQPIGRAQGGGVVLGHGVSMRVMVDEVWECGYDGMD